MLNQFLSGELSAELMGVLLTSQFGQSTMAMIMITSIITNVYQQNQLSSLKENEKKHTNILKRVTPILEKVYNKEKLSDTDRLEITNILKYIKDNCG